MSILSYEDNKFVLNTFKATWEEKRLRDVETGELDEMGNPIFTIEEYYETQEFNTNDKEYLEDLLINNNLINNLEDITWEDNSYVQIILDRLEEINKLNVPEENITLIENYLLNGTFEQTLEDGTKVIPFKDFAYVIENKKLKEENVTLMLALAELAETLNGGI